MKHTILPFLAFITALMVSTSCSAQRIFNDVPTKDGINKIYVGKAMLYMVGKIKSIAKEIPSEAIKSIDGIEVINVEKKNLVQEVSSICQKAINQLQLEPATTVANGKETITIYIQPDPQNDGIATMMVIINEEEEEEYNAIAIHGKFDIQKLAEALQNQ